jgi:hypothetical protein
MHAESVPAEYGLGKDRRFLSGSECMIIYDGLSKVSGGNLSD